MKPETKRAIEKMYNRTFDPDEFNESNDLRGGFRLGITESLTLQGVDFIIEPRKRGLKIT